MEWQDWAEKFKAEQPRQEGYFESAWLSDARYREIRLAAVEKAKTLGPCMELRAFFAEQNRKWAQRREEFKKRDREYWEKRANRYRQATPVTSAVQTLEMPLGMERIYTTPVTCPVEVVDTRTRETVAIIYGPPVTLVEIATKLCIPLSVMVVRTWRAPMPRGCQICKREDDKW